MSKSLIAYIVSVALVSSMLTGGIAFSQGKTKQPKPQNETSIPTLAISPCPNPGPLQVTIFQDANFGGKCSVLDFYSSRNLCPNSAAFGIPNDSLSSLKVGSEVTATLFEEVDYGGHCITFQPGDHPHMGSFNDRTSSIRLQRKDQDCMNPGFGNVAFFQDANFRGDCTVKGTGTYNNTAAMGMANDSISSIKVGDGVFVMVCSDANLKGRCERFGKDNDVHTLVGSVVGNDAITSAQVYWARK